MQPNKGQEESRGSRRNKSTIAANQPRQVVCLLHRSRPPHSSSSRTGLGQHPSKDDGGTGACKPLAYTRLPPFLPSQNWVTQLNARRHLHLHISSHPCLGHPLLQPLFMTLQHRGQPAWVGAGQEAVERSTWGQPGCVGGAVCIGGCRAQSQPPCSTAACSVHHRCVCVHYSVHDSVRRSVCSERIHNPPNYLPSPPPTHPHPPLHHDLVAPRRIKGGAPARHPPQVPTAGRGGKHAVGVAAQRLRRGVRGRRQRQRCCLSRGGERTRRGCCSFELRAVA